MSDQIKRMRRNRPLTAEEAAHYAEIRRKVQEEFPPKRAKKVPVALGDIMLALKDARAELGLTLAQMTERTGIEPPNLSTLENSPDANPTLATLVRYADALGKKVRVVVED